MDAALYTHELCAGKRMSPLQQPAVSRYPRNREGRAVLLPRLPRAEHCKLCPFVAECRAWKELHYEEGLPDAAALWRVRTAARRAASMPKQVSLAFLASHTIPGKRRVKRMRKMF